MSDLPRLSDATLTRLPAAVARPAYAREATRLGVVHFGPGAFHRAHQAYFFDRMLERDPGLAISAVSLHSRDVREALMPQDGLYALVEREASPSWRVLGSICEVLVAPEQPEAVMARLTSPDLRFITSTVTEKGYCLTPAGELDLEHPDIRHDLASPSVPRSFPGWLLAGLRRRHAAGLAAPVVISCDNLSGNGERLGRSIVQFARAAADLRLADWIAAEVRFPNTMVDSITPATDDALRQEAAATLALDDAWPIQRERFVQWVVEDRLGEAAPTFAAAGVTLTTDVAAFERAKLRLLNGAHSTLAYLGLLRGHATVAEAMADAPLAAFLERLMRQEIVPTLAGDGVVDLQAYVGDILARFRNPAIAHKLSQIAWDGSQKLPFRLLSTIADRLDAGLPIDGLALGVAAWMRFIARQAAAAAPIVDPLGARLASIGLACRGEADADVARFLELIKVFPARLAGDRRFRSTVTAAYAALNPAADQSFLMADL